MLPGHTRGARYGFSWTHARSALARPHARSALARYRAERAGTYVRGAHRGTLWGEAGPPEAPCAAQQCGNGAPALLVSTSTDFPNDYG